MTRLNGVLQTITTGPGQPDYVRGEREGNCVQACVATIFDMPLKAVPHFGMYPVEYDREQDKLIDKFGSLWTRTIERWLRTVVGKELCMIFYNGEEDESEDLRGITLGGLGEDEPDLWPYALANIKSPRGDYFHSVVVSTTNLEVVWDPSPSQDAYDKPVLCAESFSYKIYHELPEQDYWADYIIERDLG